MIEIRRATEADAQILAELGRATFVDTFGSDNSKEDMEMYVAETFGVDRQLTEIQDPNRMIEIAWSGTNAIGFLHLVRSKPNPTVTEPKPIELLRLYVDSLWHGKGTGAALMDRSIQIAREEGFKTLWLGVWERNFRAQAFYSKYGFTMKGEHIFRLGTDEQVDFIMARSTDPA